MADTVEEATTSTGPEDAPEAPPQTPSPEAELVESELLIEEVSIDGMCGVY